MGKGPEEPPPPDPRRTAVVGIVVVVLLIIAGLLLTHVLRNVSHVEDCVMQGRTNCAPVDSASDH